MSHDRVTDDDTDDTYTDDEHSYLQCYNRVIDYDTYDDSYTDDDHSVKEVFYDPVASEWILSQISYPTKFYMFIGIPGYRYFHLDPEKNHKHLEKSINT